MRNVKPILFNAEMIRAILEGKKTQTRRIVKPQPEFIESSGRWVWPIPKSKIVKCESVCTASREWWEYLLPEQYPYGNPDGLLWVRETWRTYESLNHLKPSEIGGNPGVGYEAGGSNVLGYDSLCGMGKVRQSIFMPRWASRITLEVKDIRVERLQDISEEDAKAEGIFFTDYGRDCFHRGGPPQDVGGCKAPESTHNQRAGWFYKKTETHEQCLNTAKTGFANLWDSINAKKAPWYSNPWLWIVTFEPYICNVDEYLKRKEAA